MFSRHEWKAIVIGWSVGGAAAFFAARFGVDLWAAFVVCLTVSVLATMAML